MPMYDYFCESCEHAFSELRPMAEYREPHPCPGCGSLAPRVVGAPRLNVLPETLRRAHETNERSAHEPKVSEPHRCGAGCGHRSAPRPRSSARPWMLGH
ncbi:MAG: zinc ribbon domain-containing protein [Gammaproteobacteria bacterium]|jgi:putative FmdB family regulatory protein|nr:zinc ribbon domain-containing protein [Gammaproteobacteria bacterium]